MQRVQIVQHVPHALTATPAVTTTPVSSPATSFKCLRTVTALHSSRAALMPRVEATSVPPANFGTL